jgi:tetratricopeptide (TPR) repeat protein
MQEQSLFIEALEKTDPTERAAFLDRACANDPARRERIERLLERHVEDDSFLGPPTAASAATARETGGETPGTRIRRYKLLQKLGEGGMGAVWMAEQTEPVQRRVAMKLIKAGMDSAQVIARFEQERQALALMDHPNIAKVLDAGGTRSGRPYFVMELVKGIPITKYCDNEHLTPKQRLELFIPVCHAVQHAHQKGIIHRDIKPSNVLIALYDGKPVPKVIDFGVAKATGQKLTERSLFTEVGVLIGTLEYMAPEQAELNNLDIDTRADIYALGVLLYELLTGSPPFTGQQLRAAAFTEMLRMIREVEPPRPSTRLSDSEELPNIAAKRRLEPKRLTSVVAGDLDWIVMKCLEKDRGRRYETANGLAGDVQRFLADEPVTAGPPGAFYRARKFVRRNHKAVLAAAVALLLLVCGIAGTTAGLLEAQQALKGEVKAREAETRRRKQAREALDAMSSDVIEDWLARQETGQLTPEQKAFLQKALTFYEEFAADTGKEESIRAAVVAAHLKVGKIRENLGLHQDAETAYRRAVQLAAELAADFPAAPAYRHELARSQSILGMLLSETGRLKEADKAYLDALAVQKQLTADSPAVPEFREELATSYSAFGTLCKETGRLKEAEHALRAAVAIMTKLVADFPSVPRYRMNLANRQNNLGEMLFFTGQLKDAEQAHRDALTIAKQLVADFPAVPGHRDVLGQIQHSLAYVLMDTTGREKEAMDANGESMDLRKQLFSEFPAVPEYHGALLAQTRRALSRSSALKVREREQDLRDALAAQQQLVAHCPAMTRYRENLAGIQMALGSLLRRPGREKEAEQELRETLRAWEQLTADFPTVPKYRRGLAANYFYLAKVFEDTARPKEAEQAIRDALAIEKQLVADFPTVPSYQGALAGSHNALGDFLRKRGTSSRRKEAEQEYRDALAIRQPLVANFPEVPHYTWQFLRDHLGLANVLEAAGRIVEAEKTCRDGLAVLKQQIAKFPKEDAYLHELADYQRNFGFFLFRSGRMKEAEEAMRDAIAAYEQLAAADSPAINYYRGHMGLTQNTLGILLSQTGRKKEAELMYRDALAVRKQLITKLPDAPKYQNDLAETLGRLAKIMLASKHYDEARRLLEEAVPHHQAALQAKPDNQTFQQGFNLNRYYFIQTLLGQSDHATAAKMTEEWIKAPLDPANDNYNAGCFFSLCVPVAEKDSKLTVMERRTLAQVYADRAMALLRESVAKGFHDAKHMAADDDLIPLRQRADFQALLKEMAKAKSAGDKGQ